MTLFNTSLLYGTSPDVTRLADAINTATNTVGIERPEIVEVIKGSPFAHLITMTPEGPISLAIGEDSGLLEVMNGLVFGAGYQEYQQEPTVTAWIHPYAEWAGIGEQPLTFWRYHVIVELHQQLLLHYHAGRPLLPKATNSQQRGHASQPTMELVLLDSKQYYPGKSGYVPRIHEEQLASIRSNLGFVSYDSYPRYHQPIPAWPKESGCVGNLSHIGVAVPTGKTPLELVELLCAYVQKHDLEPKSYADGNKIFWDKVPNLTDVLINLQRPDWWNQ